MVHHATVKKAADKGIIVEDAPEGSDYRFRAFWPERAMELWGSNAVDLTACAIYARMMCVEHNVKIEQEDDTISVTFNGHDLAEFEADLAPGQFERELMDAIEGITDEMREGAPEEDEDEGRVGSVVPERYKKQYRENGTPGNCGDWLALELKRLTTVKDVLNVEAIEAIAGANGVDASNWNRTTRGWQGRFRMRARNAMVKGVIERGVLFVPAPWGGVDDVELKAPKGWIEQVAKKRAAARETLATQHKPKKKGKEG